MTLEEYKASINFRTIEKCCGTCKHGWENCVGDCFCRHKDMQDVSGGKSFNNEYRWMTHVRFNDVCDKWEHE